VANGCTVNRSAFICGGAALAIQAPAVGADALDDRVRRVAAASSGVVGVYARTLDGDSPLVAYNADVVFPSASTIKSLILATLYAEADANPSLLTQRMSIRREDLVGGSDVVAPAPPGTKFTVTELAKAMIDQSDNSAANALITLLGFDAINQKATELGLGHTRCKRHFMDFPAIWRHSDNLTSPRDMGTLFYEIERGARDADGKVASAHACRAMIGILLRQEDREKIAAGLPRGVPLANKTGEITGVRSDVGIVDPYGARPYVLAILTKELDDTNRGVAAIRKIAHDVNASLPA
jgi:beta-lactamase class A